MGIAFDYTLHHFCLNIQLNPALNGFDNARGYIPGRGRALTKQEVRAVFFFGPEK